MKIELKRPFEDTISIDAGSCTVETTELGDGLYRVDMLFDECRLILTVNDREAYEIGFDV